LTRIRPQGENLQQISHLNSIKEYFKMVPPCKERESEMNLEKNSPLSPAIQNRVFFFCFDLLTIWEKNNTGGIQRANE